MAVQNLTTALSPRQILDGQRVLRIPGSAIRIATWNVRSLFEDGKLDNALLEMERLRLDFMGISELRWIGSGEIIAKDYVIYYSGSSDAQYHRHGVAVVIKKELKSSVRNFVPLSDRVMLLQLHAQPFNINIIQVYAPTADKKNDDSVEEFYEEIEEVLKITKNHEINVILGDFNAKVGKGRLDGVVGDFGLGERNERGDRLVQFCQEYDCVITNTLYKLPPRRLYTWTSPAHKPDNIVRNQIDYILVNCRHKNCIKSVKTYPGADIGSDHNPLVASISVKLKKVRHRTPRSLIDTSKLRDLDLRLRFHLSANNKMLRLQESDPRPTDVETTWSKFKNTMIKEGKDILPPTASVAKHDWMTSEILKLMTLRREVKGKDDQKYKDIQNTIRKKIIEAKESWLSDRCQEIEQFDAKHDSFNMHKKIKELLGNKNTTQKHLTLLDEDGQFATSIEGKLKVWEQYIQKLFHDNRTDCVNIRDDNTGPPITKEEIAIAIKQAKNGKAVGHDEIPVELLKELDEGSLDYLTHLFNLIYTSGAIPMDWLKSTFVTLPKTNNPKNCSEYRTISLMSHVLKIFLKIIHRRIYAKCEVALSKSQFGFRSGLGTRDALFGYQVLVQRCWDVNRELHICFVDYEKAFDRVRHEKLMGVLQNIGIDSRDLMIIKNLYWQQVANVRVEEQLSSYVEIVRGVRQGCILSPLLFNVYAEAIFSEALEDLQEGIVVNGQVINNIRYADDTILIADSLMGLQTLVDRVCDTSAKYGININCKKTKYMTVGRTPDPASSLNINGNNLERVTRYRYLGALVNDTGDNSLEIRCRIEQARNAFRKMSKILCDRRLHLKLRIRIVRCYVFSVLLYGAEAWTLTKAMSDKVEAFEMWVYRRMLKISWTQRVRNDTVLQRMGKDAEILNTIKSRKLQYLGHIMRNDKYDLLQLIIQGKIQGRRRPGRRRISWLRNLRDWYNKSTRSLFRAAVSRVQIAVMIANLRKETAP